MDVRDVPTTIVTGFLGAGKTTAILDLFSHRPDGARWAVLVNEFGEVGIDGAVMEAGGLSVREVPGGCICCSAGLELKVALVRLLREVKPERLLIEPTGLARPAQVLDTLRSPGIKEAVSPRATIGLVDVRRIDDPRFRERDGWLEQWQVADVLVGTHADLATAEQIARFRREAEASWPEKLAIDVISDGHLPPEWLELRPSPPAPFQVVPHITGPDGDAVTSRGWGWPPSTVFDRDRLEAALQELVRPSAALPAGILRMKGIFRTPRVWLHVNGTPDTLSFRAIDHRRDSRAEWIAPAAPDPDWDAVEALLLGCRLRA